MQSKLADAVTRLKWRIEERDKEGERREERRLEDDRKRQEDRRRDEERKRWETRRGAAERRWFWREKENRPCKTPRM